MKSLIVYFIIFLLSPVLLAQDAETEGPAYWDYGFGLGAVRYEQYPASNEYSILAVPAPTFQYRGKILRADDQDGAHLYLYKGTDISVELAGTGHPALDSSKNEAREGMADLPWLIALGPELITRKIEDFEFGVGAYQAVTTDFTMTRASGVVFDARATYRFNFPFSKNFIFSEPGISSTRLTFSLKGGNTEYQALYFEVPPENATADRPAYTARDGLMSYSLSYYQSFKSGRFSLNVGALISAYDLSANRNSPLHKSDHNVTGIVALNYILGGSGKPEIPENETSGVINSLRKNRQLRDN